MIADYNISQLITQAEQSLSPVSDSAKLDAQILLAFVLEKPTSYLLTWPEKVLTQNNIRQFESLLNRRLANEPIAYIVGYKEFWSLNFKVSPATLIPRPDTEVLVETVLAHYDNTPLSCLDLGTGTGAIALALASERSNWQIDAIDFQHQAVALAKENAKELALKHVNIYQSDWFESVSSKKRFDMIVSNPPYIDEKDPHLKQGDVVFEPKSALVALNKGLADIEHITLQARRYLRNNGRLYFEHGFEQADDVQNILRNTGFINVQTVKDYNDNDRITFAQYAS